MPEYIDREAAYPFAKKICDAIDSKEFQRLNFGMRILDWIDDIPAADVQPVVRGKWEHLGSDVWRCSQCGYGIMPWNAGQNFCPNCGADMRGGDGNG